jgi:antirestriction protein
MNTTPRIYVGTYAKYNDGNLFGAWLDLDDYSDKESFEAACFELHKDEHDPELMFQDWENIPDGMIGESHLSADVFDWLELDEKDRRILQAYRDNIDQTGSLEDATDAYRGTYDKATDFAEEFYAAEIQHLSFTVQNFIDWSAAVRELEYSGVTFVQDGGECLVFVS